jgi:hypothetical protein
MAQIKTREGVSDNLIDVVNAGMDGSWRLGRQGWRARPAEAARQSKPLPALWFTKLNKVPTLLTVGLRQATMAAGVGGAARCKLSVDGGELRGSSG